MTGLPSRVLPAITASRTWLWVIFFLAGISLATAGRPWNVFWLIALPVSLVAAAGAAFLGRASLAFIFIMLFSLCLGAARQGSRLISLEKGDALLVHAGGSPLRMLLRVDEPPEQHEEYTVLWVTILQVMPGDTWEPARTKARMTVGDDLDGVFRGDRLLTFARIDRPRSFQNPGGFDYSSYLARRGVVITGRIKSAHDLAPVRGRLKISPAGLTDRARARYLTWLRSFQGDGGALVGALLAGDRERLSRPTRDAFSSLGISHLLAISGLHLGLVAGSCYFLFMGTARRISWLTRRMAAQRAAALATIFIVAAYALMTGMRVPTQRALVMVVTYMLAVAMDREQEVWNALGLAAAMILFIWPDAFQEASFQLSFAAVGGILYSWPRLSAALSGRRTPAQEELDRLEAALGGARNRWMGAARRYLGGLLAVTLLVHWTILPLQLYYFKAFNPLAPLYNLLLIPLTGICILPPGLLASVIALTSPDLGSIIMTAPVFFAETAVGAVQFCAAHFNTLTVTYPPSVAAAFAWYAGGALFLEGLVALRNGHWWTTLRSPEFFRRRHFGPGDLPISTTVRSLAKAVLSVSILLIGVSALCFCLPPERLPRGSMILSAIEVGQGQALFLSNGSAGTMLVDGGGFPKSDYDVGQGIVAPTLLYLGIRRLDVVVLTHPHPDHGKGLAYILSHFPVGEFWRPPPVNEITQELDSIARDRGIAIRVIDESTRTIGWADSEVTVLNPPPGGREFSGDLNENSLVLRVESGQCSFLLTGDIGHAAEARLVERYGPEGTMAGGRLRSLVMSVPHHGSRKSSSVNFIETVFPESALVSAGGADWSRLPSSEVIEKYSARGIEILRTDRDGFVAVLCDGGSIGEVSSRDAFSQGLVP